MAKIQRHTRQRNAIRRAFAVFPGQPLSPKEVQDHASKSVPNLGIATIYRNLKAMREEGLLIEVEIPGQPTRFALPKDQTRILFLCQETGSIFYLPELDPDLKFPTVPEGYDVREQQVLLFGTSPRQSGD